MVRHVILLDIVGLESSHLDSNAIPNIANLANEGVRYKMEPVFPAVTCTVQASLLSGQYPNQHGIISNGIYDRANYTISSGSNQAPWFKLRESGTLQNDKKLLPSKLLSYLAKIQCIANPIL